MSARHAKYFFHLQPSYSTCSYWFFTTKIDFTWRVLKSRVQRDTCAADFVRCFRLNQSITIWCGAGVCPCIQSFRASRRSTMTLYSWLTTEEVVGVEANCWLRVASVSSGRVDRFIDGRRTTPRDHRTTALHPCIVCVCRVYVDQNAGTKWLTERVRLLEKEAAGRLHPVRDQENHSSIRMWTVK